MKEKAKEGMKDLLAAESAYVCIQRVLRKKCLSGPCSRPDFEAWMESCQNRAKIDTVRFRYPSGGSHPRAHILPGPARSGR